MKNTVRLVEFRKPEGCAGVAAGLIDLATRADKGEFAGAYLVLFKPDGDFMTLQLGAPIGRLRAIGALEMLKSEVIEAALEDSTGDPGDGAAA